MKFRIVTALLGLLVGDSCAESIVETSDYSGGAIRKIEQYQVTASPEIRRLVGEDNPGLGSSLILRNNQGNGELEFFALTDRGLNFRVNTSNKKTAQLFTNPQFQPFISVIKVCPGVEAMVHDVVKLNTHGLPRNTDLVSVETMIDTSLRKILVQRDGVDSEAIALDRDGNFWIGEEYGPAILKVNKFGTILERYCLGNGLPDVIKHRILNRGIEAIEVKDDGSIIFAVESVLDIDERTKNNALFVRIVEFNPKTKTVRTFAYPYDYNYYDDITSIKISDFSYIDDQHILVVEQGSKNAIIQNQIKIIDISGATDISGMKLVDGRELEFANSLKELAHIKMVRKNHIVNMREYGWKHEKLEGLAYINEDTIAIINDNDFGSSMEWSGHSQEKQQKFEVDLDKAHLKLGNKIMKASIRLKDTGQKTNLWIIYLSKSLLS